MSAPKGETVTLSIAEGWAYDADGQPTTDPAAALKGTMVPAGGYKGAGTALIVELMAAVLSGTTLSVRPGTL